MADSRIEVYGGTTVTLTEGKTYTAEPYDGSGGAVYVAAGGTLTGKNVTFSGNTASTWGGAIYNNGTIIFTGETVTFTGNKATGSSSYGSAICSNAAEAAITFDAAAEFSYNESKRSAGAIYSARDTTLTFNKTVSFTGNTAANYGGALSAIGTTTFNDEVTFSGNTGKYGGAIDLDKGVINFNDNVTFAGNVATENISTGAIIFENTGTINFAKTMALVTPTDTIYVNSQSTLNWNLAASGEAKLTGFDKLTNDGGKLTITVKDDQATGDYVIATGDLSDLIGKDSFTVKTADKELGTVTVGGAEVIFGARTYLLKVDESDLRLTVGYAGPTITIDTEEKWFNAGDTTVTVTGTVSDTTGKGIKSFVMTGIGAEPVTLALDEKGNWSYTYTGENTKGTELTFTATDNDNNVRTASYTLKVDTVAPEIQLDFTQSQYHDNEKSIEWYQASATGGTVTATGYDETSGIGPMSLNGGTYTSGSEVAVNLSAELDSPVTKTFGIVDVAGNTGSSVTFKYDVDGSGPVIGEGTFSGDSMYVVPGDGTVWFRRYDNTAKLTMTISDSKSGLKSASYSKKMAYDADKGYFVLNTADYASISAFITASDNVGNETSSSARVTYNCDGWAPTITVTQNPAQDVCATSVTVTAEFADIGSELKSKQYSFDGTNWQDYTEAFTVTENCTLYFKAADNVGNVTEKTLEITNIDTVPPVITITADTKTIVEKLTFSATATDAESGVKVFEYSTDGGKNWTPYTDDEPITTKVRGTYIFHAKDNADNISTEEVTFNNIYSKAEKADEIIANGYELTVGIADTIVTKRAEAINGGSLSINGDLMADNVFIMDSKVAVNGDGIFDAGTIVFRNGVLTVDVNAAANGIIVDGGSNTINGYVQMADNGFVEVANGVTLAIDKNQFDRFMGTRNFKSDGKLNVVEFPYNDLTEQAIQALINLNTVREVNFQQDLLNIHDIAFAANSALNIGFRNGYGTFGGDRIEVKKNAAVTFGSEDYVIDLAEGKNKFYVRNNANVTLLSNLVNVSEVTVNTGDKKTVGGVKYQAYTNANFADITFSDAYNGTFTVGKFAYVSASAVEGGLKTDKIVIGSNSAVASGDVTGIESIKVSDGTKYTPVSGGDKVQGKTSANFKNITAYNKFTLTAGNYTTVVVRDSLEASEFADKLTIGKNASFSADYVVLGDGDDKVSVGKEAVVKLGNFSMGSGKDTLNVGDYANVNVSGNTQFDSFDTVTVGKGTTVVFKALASNAVEEIALKKFTLGKDAQAYLSSELVGAVTKADKTAQVFDIGESFIAANFTDIDTELSDNTIETAGELIGEYNGWLNSSLDTADFFEIGVADELIWSADSGLVVTLYDADGTGTVVTGGSAVTTGCKAFAVSVAEGEEEKKSYWYTATLA